MKKILAAIAIGLVSMTAIADDLTASDVMKRSNYDFETISMHRTYSCTVDVRIGVDPHRNDEKCPELEKRMDERSKRIDKEHELPAPKIGMTIRQVIEETNRGLPNDINSTYMEDYTEHQFVYQGYSSYSFFYFRDGKLYAIQN